MKDFVWNILQRFAQLVMGSYAEIKLLQESNQKLQKANKELLEHLTPPSTPEVTGDITGGHIR